MPLPCCRSLSIFGLQKPNSFALICRTGCGILDEAVFTGADLSGATCKETYIHHVPFKKARMINTDMMKATLGKGDFSQADLSGANILGAKLERAVFSEATLAHADFSFAKLPYSDLRGTRLKGAMFKGAARCVQQ